MDSGAFDPFTESEAFRRWGEFILRWRWLALILTLAVAALAGWSALKWLRFDPDLGEIDRDLDPRRGAFERHQETFGHDVYWLVVLRGDLLSSQGLIRLRALQDDLGELRLSSESGDTSRGPFAFSEIFSILDATKTRFVDGRPVIERYFEPLPEGDELTRTRAAVLDDPLVSGQIIDAEGRHSAIFLQTEGVEVTRHEETLERLQFLMERHQAPGFEIFLAGRPPLLVTFKELLITDMPKLLLITVALLVVLMLLIFRHGVAVVGPLAVVLISAVETFGGMAALGLPMTTVTTVIPVLLFCVCLGGAVHLISTFRELRDGGVATHEAVVRALAMTGVPISFAAMTTAVGLLSFSLAGIEAIRNMGLSASLGVGLTLSNTMIVLPIALSFVTKSHLGVRSKLGGRGIDEALHFCLRLAGVGAGARRQALTVVVSCLVLGAALIGMSKLRLGYDPLRRIPQDSPLQIGFKIMDERLGGINQVSLLVESRELSASHGTKTQSAANPRDAAGFADLEVITSLARLSEHVHRYRDPEEGDIVGPSMGFLMLLKSIRCALEGGERSAYRLPANQREVDEVFEVIERSPRSLLEPVLSREGGVTQITFRVAHIDALGYQPFAAYIERGIDEFASPSVLVRPTGSVYTDMTINNLVTHDLVRSFGLAFVVISILMVAVFRSLRIGLLAMLPNLLPIALVMGLMGFLGIRGDIDTILIASIALGIVVDDTIHILHQYRVHLARGDDVERALRGALDRAGRAIIATSVVLMTGFLVLLASSLSNVRIFGLLISLIGAQALIADLIVTPALISLVFGRRAITAPVIKA